MTPASGYRAHLDGIRAVAVGLVILFHLGLKWVPGGFVGVDVFFVMSGYLITGLLLGEVANHEGVRFRRFYARRMRRLLPASALVLIVVMFGASQLFDMVDQQSVGHEATWAALYSANWKFVAGNVDYFTPGDLPSPLVHFWSLAVEEQFYLVWPALFALLWKVSTRRKGPEATGGLLMGIVAIGAASIYLSLTRVPSPEAYYGTHTRAYQLLAGGALAVAARRWAHRLPTGDRVRLLGTATVVGSLGGLLWLSHQIADAGDYPGVAALWVTFVSVVLIAGLDLTPAGPTQRLFGSAPLAGVGRLSYSLYLWHWPVIVFLPLLAQRWGVRWLGGVAAMVVVMTAAAVGSYFLVERPIRFKLVPTLSPMRVVGVGLVVSVLVAVVGIPFLQPRDQFQDQALAAVENQPEPGPCPYTRWDWGTTETVAPCLYREGGDTVVALVGDSHAQQWQPAFDEMAERHDLTVIRLTRQGCPPNDITIYTYDDQGAGRPDHDCTTWRRKVYPELIERYDPDVIYLETRSHEWEILADGDDVDAGTDEHLAEWADGWRTTLDLLTSGTGQVVVGTTTPTIGWKVPACLAEHGRNTTDCDMPLADDTEVVPYNEIIGALPDEMPGVIVVDTTPFICPDSTCPAMIDGIIVHRDDDHVTAAFARHEAGEFEAMLRNAGVDLDGTS
ncbi:MAG: acyltransferase family protein [Aquihabitans sp.]